MMQLKKVTSYVIEEIDNKIKEIQEEAFASKLLKISDNKGNFSL